MSSIPPNTVGPIAQAGMAAARQSEKVDQEENDEAARAQGQRRAALLRQGMVDDAEGADEHAHVDPDDQKFSRQGKRERAEQDQEEEPAENKAKDDPSDGDKDDRPRLDITA